MLSNRFVERLCMGGGSVEVQRAASMPTRAAGSCNRHAQPRCYAGRQLHRPRLHRSDNARGIGVSVTAVCEALRASRVIPVLRLATREAAEVAIDCLIEAGYRTVELTLTMPGAIGLITELKRRALPDFLVGAGTVLDLD